MTARVAVVLLSALALSPWSARAGKPEAEIVARIDGEPVTRAALQRMVANPHTLSEGQRLLGVERPDASALEGLAMRRIVELRVLVAEAHRRHVQVTDRELEAEVKALRRRFDDLKGFGAWMREQGLDEGTVFDAIREDLDANRARAAIAKEVHLSEDEVRSYLEAHPAELRREEVHLQIIAVPDEWSAQEVLRALKTGRSFASVARKRSHGQRAAAGGEAGWVKPETLAPPLREAVAALKPRQYAGPVKRGSELLVVRLEERRERPMSLEEARPEIERRLLPAKRRRTLEAWLAERERAARVEVVTLAAAGGAP